MPPLFNLPKNAKKGDTVKRGQQTMIYTGSTWLRMGSPEHIQWSQQDNLNGLPSGVVTDATDQGGAVTVPPPAPATLAPVGYGEAYSIPGTPGLWRSDGQGGQVRIDVDPNTGQPITGPGGSAPTYPDPISPTVPTINGGQGGGPNGGVQFVSTGPSGSADAINPGGNVPTSGTGNVFDATLPGGGGGIYSDYQLNQNPYAVYTGLRSAGMPQWDPSFGSQAGWQRSISSGYQPSLGSYMLADPTGMAGRGSFADFLTAEDRARAGDPSLLANLQTVLGQVGGAGQVGAGSLALDPRYSRFFDPTIEGGSARNVAKNLASGVLASMGGPGAYNKAMYDSMINRYNTMAFPAAGGDISGQTGLGQFANWLSGRVGGTPNTTATFKIDGPGTYFPEGSSPSQQEIDKWKQENSFGFGTVDPVNLGGTHPDWNQMNGKQVLY